MLSASGCPKMRQRLPSFFSTYSIFAFFFLFGWVAYQFSLVDLGRYSFLPWHAVCIGIIVVKFDTRSFTTPYIYLPFISGLIALVVALLFDFPGGHILGNVAQSVFGLMLAASVSNINWDAFAVYFDRYLSGFAVLVFGYGLYQFFARKYNWPYGFLPMTNLQLATDDGLQRGANNIFTAKAYFGRVSSFFPEPSDMGRFFLWFFVFALLRDRGGGRMAMLALAVFGVLLSQSLGAAIGLLFLIVVYSLVSARLYGLLIAFFSVSALLLLIYLSEGLGLNVHRRIVEYTTGGWDALSGTARFAGFEAQFGVIEGAILLGYGIGQASAVINEGLISSSLVLLLIERGLFGMALFVVPWVFILFYLFARWRHLSKVGRIACLLLTLEFYCLLNFAMLYFFTIYFAYGFALWALRSNRKRYCDGSRRLEVSR